MAPSHRKKLCSQRSLKALNLQLCLFLCSNVCTGVIVFLGFYCSTQLTSTVSTDKVGRQLLVDLYQSESDKPLDSPNLHVQSHPYTPPPLMDTSTTLKTPPTSIVKIVSSTIVYHSFSKIELLYLESDHHSNMLCKILQETLTNTHEPSVPSHTPNHTPSISPSVRTSGKQLSGSLKRVSRDDPVVDRSSNHSLSSNRTVSNHTTSSLQSNSSSNSNDPSHKPTHLSNQSPSAPNSVPDHTPSHLSTPAPAKTVIVSQDVTDEQITQKYTPYVIGITPTYYRMTQRLDLTSLCQTLMNVPRFLWIVVEDANSTSSQVKDILSHCRVESVLLHTKTTNETKKAKQRGVDQRNLAIDWIRDRCKGCDGRGTCEGVVYFMDDDNTFDIRLFEKIRWTQNVSVFPVGFVAGLKFEGPVCKDGKVERWQVQYAPKRHIPVDMAAFALHVHVLTRKPKVRMGFKPDGVKRSTPGYLEPDFLKSLGAKRETVECRGASDEILVWHVKSTYKSLVHEKKHPSDPKVKV